MIIRHFFGNLSRPGVLVDTSMNNFDSAYSVMKQLSLIWIISGSTCAKEDPKAFFLKFVNCFFCQLLHDLPSLSCDRNMDWLSLDEDDVRMEDFRIYIMNLIQWLSRYEVCMFSFCLFDSNINFYQLFTLSSIRHSLI